MAAAMRWLCVILAFAAVVPVAAAQTVTLSGDVRIGAMESPDDPCYTYAVSELERLLQRVNIGISEHAVPNTSETWQLQLLFGEQGEAPSANVDGIQDDGYAIVTSPTSIILVANQPKGILNAVYGLAERIGYLFLYPGIEGEWPPLAGPSALPLGTVVERPRFPHRGIFNGNGDDEWLAYYAKLRMNAFCNPIDKDLAAKLGLRAEVGGHELDELYSRDEFVEHPDMFRMSQPEDFFGTRTDDFNLCVSSPYAKKIVQDSYLDTVREKQNEGYYAWHTWPEDLPGEGWCYCPVCRSLTPSDQATVAMNFLAVVIRDNHLPMRVPMLAYHDTMFPGTKVTPWKELFLLFAPRERCYAHALDDPACPKNRDFLAALDAWTKAFSGTDDAHTFEYYLDRVLFRGLYPFLPDVILRDMKVYEEHHIQTHLTLQVGTAFVPRLAMLNLPLFGHGCWDASLDPKTYITDTANRILPDNLEPFVAYFTTRAKVFESVMRWEHKTDSWSDYRWIPETPLPYGREMATAYREGADSLDAAADALEEAVQSTWPERVKAYAKSEVGRTRFEAVELRNMELQQTAASDIGDYMQTFSETSLKVGLATLKKAREAFKATVPVAQNAGVKDGDYYYMFNTWIQKEITGKIDRWKAYIAPAPVK